MATHRVINFNAGPASLPIEALERARDEMLDFAGSGMSIMEHSHRGKEYEGVHNEAVALLRRLLSIGDDYEVLFLQGGASQQFAMVPMNFLRPGHSADYILTGAWSEKALQEAKVVGAARAAGSTAVEGKYTRIPTPKEIELDPKAAYVHLTSNNTIFGTQWFEFPDTRGVPLMADMSSDFLWRKFDVRKFKLIYAGAQKNIGPSGVVAVIAEKALLETGRTDIPKIFRYATHAKENSLYNTPPTFSIYMIRNVLELLEKSGGLDAMEKQNREKGRILYGCMDRLSHFYRGPVETGSRSLMNVVFRLPSEELETRFVSEAKAAGMVGLKGHRSVGGIRVSTYNAVGLSAVRTLVDFMDEFARKAG